MTLIERRKLRLFSPVGPRWGALVVAALLASACGDDDAPDEPGGSGGSGGGSGAAGRAAGGGGAGGGAGQAGAGGAGGAGGAAGGACDETFFHDAPCADGARWDVADPTTQCPGGNLRNTCCRPWDEPCSFVAGSMTLSLDPFTCAPPSGDGAPWTCIHLPEQSSCSIDAVVVQPFAGTYDADVRATASFGGALTVAGAHNVTGRTFTCTGKASYDPLTAETWSCTACAGEACGTCAVVATGFCSL